MNQHPLWIDRYRPRFCRYCKRCNKKHRLAYIFISHDLQVVRAMCHQVVVVRQGQVVEQGSAEALFRTPQAPYTRN